MPILHKEGTVLEDKLWRLNNLYTIKMKSKKLRPMELNRVQQDYLLRRKLRNFILKARQLGFTTLCLIDMLDETINNPGMNSAILAHEKQKVTKLFEIVKRAYENLPEGTYKPRASLDNKNEIYFPDLDSKIYVTMDTRGETVHNLHVSELAFIRDADNRMAATLESVPRDGRITFETTANGMANYAYDEWVNPETNFTKFFYPWTVDPQYSINSGRSMAEIIDEYQRYVPRYGLIPRPEEEFNLTEGQMEFYLSKVKDLKELIVQEYPFTAIEAFRASGSGVFAPADLQKHTPRSPISRRYGELLVWEEPIPNFSYSIGVDPAEGTGGDNSVIEVINANTGQQVAEYASSRIPADELANLVMKVAKEYNHAFVVPEINSPALISHLRRKYDNIYRREVIDNMTQRKEKKLGWRTTAMSKKKLVEDEEEAIRQEDVHIVSEAALNELHTFIRHDGSGKHGYGAEGTKHDDRVIAIGLAIQGMKESPRLKKPVNIAEQKLKEFIESKRLERNFPNAPVDQSPMIRHRKKYTLRGVNRA